MNREQVQDKKKNSKEQGGGKHNGWQMAVVLGKALLTALAFTTVFHAPLVPEYYGKIDYITASVYELLGEYDFTFVMVFVIGVFFYRWTESVGKAQSSVSGTKKAGERALPPHSLLALFFAFCLLMGRSYYEAGNWSYCFGSLVNFIKFALCLAGYAFVLQAFMELLAAAMGRARSKGRFLTEKEHFFSDHAFGKTMGILLLVYSPVLLLSFPGNLCWDVIGQIEQVIFESGYSAHHPLFHTLLVGGLVQLGEWICGSYEAGLFVYVLLQTLLLTAAMAATVAVLAKRRVAPKYLWGMIVLYAVTPVYSNLTSTAIKDVPFTAAVIGYLICFALLLEDAKRLKEKKFVLGFLALQVAVILLRNNGLPLVILSGIGGFLVSFKKYNGKEKIQGLLTFFLAAVMAGSLCTALLSGICNAASGSKGEILSVCFQQTARYLQQYEAELPEGERLAIETVLGEAEQVAAAYNPNISDPVKALYKKDATAGEMGNYLLAWGKGFFRHPAVYLEAFFQHVYGWFAPNVTNSVRYEVQYDTIGQGMLFPNAEKVMVFLYRFANRFTLLGILENVGMAVWALFFYSNLQRKEKQTHMLAASLPLWVSLLICMASPCFFGHPRYALPILLGLPFLYGVALSGRPTVEAEEK